MVVFWCFIIAMCMRKHNLCTPPAEGGLLGTNPVVNRFVKSLRRNSRHMNMKFDVVGVFGILGFEVRGE